MRKFSRFFHAVAGTDPAILERCPMTDKIWSAQIGASLILSTCFVFIIALHSTSYVPSLSESVPLRLLVAALIALTIFLFDRAVFQSDWFRHGYFRHGTPLSGGGWKQFLEKIAHVGGRLVISIVIAGVLSEFLVLAVFSGSIIEKLQEDHRSANASSLARMDAYRQEQEEQVRIQRATIRRLEQDLAVTSPSQDPVEAPADMRLSDIAQQHTRLAQREQQLLGEIRTKEAEISSRQMEVICEKEGTKPDGHEANRCSGRPTCGPRCRTAIQLIKVHEGELRNLQNELGKVKSEAAAGDANRDAILAEQKVATEKRRRQLDQRQRDLDEQISRKRSELAEFEVAISARIKAYEQEIESAPGYTKFRDDPLMRLLALEKLKSDPETGSVLTLFALGLKLLVIFLEVVPVVAKIFFFPPSAYAIHVQKRVERHQTLNLENDDRTDTVVDERPADEGWSYWREQELSGSRVVTARRRHLTVVP